MSFEYGSEKLGIKNPFKFEGLVTALRGVGVSLLGVLLLLSVAGHVEEGSRLQGWISMGMGGFLLSAGLYAIGKGMMQFMKFFVGRNAPSSLARNMANGSDRDGIISYTPDSVDEMLMGRKNMTFIEPKGWLARLVHSIMPSLIYMPFPVRNIAQSMISGLLYTLFAFACFGLAWFSGYTQLTDITQTSAFDWIVVALTAYILLVWFSRIRYVSKRGLHTTIDSLGAGRVLSGIIVAILAPVGLSLFNTHVKALPPVPFEGHVMALIAVVGFAVLIFTCVMTLVISRARSANPLTEVSEYRDNWQENIHPRELYVNFEDIIMANRRYKEIPNRVIKAFDPQLIEEGSNDKGSFVGRVIQETQPAYRTMPVSNLFKSIRMGGTVLSSVLLFLSALSIYMGIDIFEEKANYNANDVINYVFYPVLFGIFGNLLYSATHIFWSEVQFESTCVLFNCQGTYTESRLSTGASIYDSTRSENVVVRSSMTPWIIVSRFVTTTFAESGQYNLEQARYIMEMHSDDEERDKILSEIRQFIDERQVIANISNKDMESASNLLGMNSKSHEMRMGSGSPAVQTAHVQLPQGNQNQQLEHSGDVDLDADIDNG